MEQHSARRNRIDKRAKSYKERKMSSEVIDESLVRSIDRAIDILKAFTTEKGELSLSEISSIVNLPKSTTHRILNTLLKRHIIEQNLETSLYYLGFETIRIGAVAKECTSIAKEALPEMHLLVKQSEQTCNLYVKRGFERLCIEQVEGLQYVKRFSYLGALRPLYCGSGKVLLAYSDSEFQKQFFEQIELTKFTERTIVDKKLLHDELSKIRERGYSFSIGEFDPTTASIAVPIYDYTNKVVAAITISGPSFSFNEENIKRFAEYLLASSERLSKKLGYRLP